MKTISIYAMLIAALLLGPGCNKDNDSLDNSCEKLSTGLSADDAGITSQGVNQLIAKLPSAKYTGDNLMKLAEKMSSGCGITTTLTCLNCNHTDPLESELTVNYTVGGVAKQKIIVITITASEKMVFKEMHD